MTYAAPFDSNLRSLQTQSNRHAARLGLAIALALFTGIVTQNYMPGSVLAIVPFVLFLVLSLRQFKLGWNTKAAFAAILNLMALTAVGFEPGFVNISVSWFSLAAFTLMQQGAALTNMAMLLTAAFKKLIFVPTQLLRDVETIKAVRTQLQSHKHILTLANLALPVAAVLIFGALLMQANPLIESLAFQISWGNPSAFFRTWGPLVALAAFALIWSVLRMRIHPGDYITQTSGKIWAEHFLAVSTVTLTLVLLNAMFFLENFLDYKYVWLGQAMPPHMNYAEYVHRGAYTLIATAIAAGALVTFILQPGADTEKSRPLRGLVYLWVLQNLALVFSSTLRTLAYIEAYGMTQWRLAGLIWMGIVAAGLIWIIVRSMFRLGHLWLVNANLISTFLVLFICGFINFNAIVAGWNASRALKSPLPQFNIDMKYLVELGPSALPSVQRLQTIFQNDYYWSSANDDLKAKLASQQANWQTWTLRGSWMEFMSH